MTGAFDTYANRLTENRAYLSNAVEAINLYEGRVIVWGAGRIFDLMLHFSLDVEKVFVVDTYLSERDEVEVHSPREVIDYVPDLVVIASRVYHTEIKNTVSLLAPYANVVGWKELGVEATRKVRPTN